MAKLFGFSIDETEEKSASIISPVPKNNEDGVDNYIASGFYGQYVDIEGAYRSEPVSYTHLTLPTNSSV